MTAYERIHDAVCIAGEGLAFFVGMAGILSLLFLAGCGSEPEPAVVARTEVCTVRLLPGGQVECRCGVVK